mgnify:CR=1 FL=1
MNLHEYQAKEILSGYGVKIAEGGLAYSPEDAVQRARDIGGHLWVVKAQIHAGGRGKGGGVKLAKNLQQVEELARAIAQSIQTTLQKQDHATLAVSGGKSPIKLFERLSRYDLAWEKVTITLVDERFLAVDHPDSNENLVRNHLLINHAEKAFFNGLVTTRNALTSVSNANLHIKQIDIAILGMGGLGHLPARRDLALGVAHAAGRHGMDAVCFHALDLGAVCNHRAGV